MKGGRAGRIGAAGLVGYLAGTIPSADIAARLATASTVDLRASGSGNPGGANAVALLGRGWGGGVIAADIAKAAVGCGVGRRIAGPAGANAAGAAAVIGHCYPAWTGFRGGGKGVACSAGQCLATFPAFFPLDLAVAWGSASRRWRARAMAGTAISSLVWVAAATLWWRRRWPNLWGPEPTAALPLAAAASSVVIMHRFVSARSAVDRQRPSG
ncbi:MAG: glycerol-3-phosphate acyltransferase [Acidimicrobiales bacterium]